MVGTNNALAADALVRQDLMSFIIRTFATLDDAQKFRPNWHLELIADRLEQAFERKIKRLIINVPPRSLKSICASVAFPAWALGQNPKLRFICASYAQDLAGKHARDCRTIMESHWFRDLFPLAKLSADKRAEEQFETRAGGCRFSTSVGGTMTGRGGNFVIIDDPIKPQDAHSALKRMTSKTWLDETVLSRLDDKKNDVIILIMQRVHVDDLTAYVMEKGGWEVLRLPAIAEHDENFRLADGSTVGRKAGEALHADHEPIAVLDRWRADMGTLAFSAQYQQTPIPLEGNIIKREWFQTYDRHEEDSSDQIVQSWDVAMTSSGNSDWSVCTTWLIKNKTYKLLHVLRERLTFPELKRKIPRHAALHRAKTVLIEDAGLSIGLVQQLKSEGKLCVIGCRPEGCKAARMETQSVFIESGNVQVPKAANWLDSYLAELLAFPGGRHDDQVDSTSQFLCWAVGRNRRRAGILF